MIAQGEKDLQIVWVIVSLIVSEIIGIIGLMLFDHAIRIKFLPNILATAGAIIAPIVIPTESKVTITPLQDRTRVLGKIRFRSIQDNRIPA